jgi:hypothetical protein
MMSLKSKLIGLVILLMAAACAPVPQAEPEPATAQLETLAAAEAALIEPTVAPLLAGDDQPEAIFPECDDPFTGENVRFSLQDWETNFCLHSVPYSEIFSGGPPRDGIPPIDAPKFESVESADNWLGAREPVILFQISEDIRAYPLQILTWHEIVNDAVGGIPVVITFCPLCNTALVFERPVLAGEVLTFGTSGNLRNSDLVMYDRQTESWWQQFSGEAIVGDLTGTQLTFLPASIISWADFKSQFPGGQVLSTDTGFRRNYGANPYVGYDDVNQSPFLFTGELDDRLRPMERVLGILLPDDSAAAYTFERLNNEQVINDTLGETPIVAFWKSGTTSALDTATIASGKDVGSTGVFLRTIRGETLTFVSNQDGTFKDEQTNSVWNLSGRAVEGRLKGAQLTALAHHDTFWFAWAAFVPADTLNPE